MPRFTKFETLEALVRFLISRGYRQTDDGEWWRNSFHALVSQQKNGIWRVEFV